MRYVWLLVFLFISPLIFINGQSILTQSLFMQLRKPSLLYDEYFKIQEYSNLYQLNILDADSIELEFGIFLPSRLLNSSWSVDLKPSVYSSYDEYLLPSIVVKGVQYAEKQQQQYSEYNQYIESIIDSIRYAEFYIDQEKYKNEVRTRHDMYWKFYYDEWEKQIEYEIWKSKQIGSVRSFSKKDQKSYKDELLKQYQLRILNQSKRYLEASMDTTGISKKYMDEYKLHIAKLPRFFVDTVYVLKHVPKKFKYIYDSRRSLEDITNNMLDLLVKRDSALMSVPVYDYSKIIENEKRSILQHEIFSSIVTLPKSEKTIVDTVIHDITRDFEILYKYRLPYSESLLNDTIEVRLDLSVQAVDASSYQRSAIESIFFLPSMRKNVNISHPSIFSADMTRFKGKDVMRSKFEDINLSSVVYITTYNADLLSNSSLINPKIDSLSSGNGKLVNDSLWQSRDDVLNEKLKKRVDELVSDDEKGWLKTLKK